MYCVVVTSFIQALNLPLNSILHFRAMLYMLIYVDANLAPAGTQTNLFGLLTFPITYLPYVLLVMDLIMSGPPAVARGITGLVMGHLWWWSAWVRRDRPVWVEAPRFLRSLMGDGPATGSMDGVHITAPRRDTSETVHRWGAGQRLGSS